MSKVNPYEVDLDKNPANFAPLTPLSFIQRTAQLYPCRRAVVHGARVFTWSETYKRCRRLDRAYELVSNVMACSFTHEEGREGMDAFIEKRKPNWKA